MATMMMTMTRAAKAGTNLTLSVVPPQDAVEERFQMEYHHRRVRRHLVIIR